MTFSYENFINRNHFFINDSLQQKIKNTTLVFVGCGLASVMAEMAARIGFENFVLVDPDKVELSNLNRQSYNLEDIESLKIAALEKKILSINPSANIALVNKEINSLQDINDIVSQGEIIINTIDYGHIYFSLIEQAVKCDKFAICLFNPGFGGLAVCFKRNSGSLYDLLGTDRVEYGINFSKKLIMNNLAIEIPYQMRNNLDSIFEQIVEAGHEPQITIGVTMSSAIGLTCVIKHLDNEEVPCCPEIIFRGLYSL